MTATKRVVEERLEMLKAATEANLATAARQGNLVRLAAAEGHDVMLTADLHGHQANWDRLMAAADLAAHPHRHLLLQEVCHGGPQYEGGGDKSHLMLEAVAELKLEYPEQVHFILSNHELSELTEFPITKDGKLLALGFRLGIQQAYGDDADRMHHAYMGFISSCPIGLLLPGDVLCVHSTPESVDFEGFDASVFDRPLQITDLYEDGEVFRMVWGRDFRRENAEAFAEACGAKSFVLGHTPCPRGFNVPNEYVLILDCCNRPAAYAIAPLSPDLDQERIVAGIVKIE